MASLSPHVESRLKTHETTPLDHTLDISLFSPQHLDTEEGLHKALVALDRSLWHDDLEPLELTLRQLMAGGYNLLAYIVAIVLDEEGYQQLLFMLRRTFPSTASAFASSLASDLINHLREFYIFFVSSEVPRGLDDRHRNVVLALNVLKALKSLKLDTDLPPTPCQGEIKGVRFKQSQQKRKHAKHRSRSTFTTDSAPFSAIGSDIPCTEKEVANLEHKILEGQKEALEDYLSVLRQPTLASAIKKSYLLSKIPSVPQNAGTKASNTEVTAPSRDSSALSKYFPAYPQIQPLKAAQYFSEPAEGFGQWKLFLSTRAIQHLKSFRRDEHTRWIIIKKKMQNLSNAIFSDSNQKRLLGGDLGVPLYQSKVDRDLRIIYQIDLAPDDTTGNDHQVIKIWGIQTHAQMDSNRLWKSISYHQSRITGEYRRRCLYRQTAQYSGNTVIVPASWPSNAEKILSEDVLGDRDTSMTTDEQLELHSILALEKFTRMSQALMNSILAGEDDTYAFELTGPEQEIRDHSSSCFVLGRSGTGKTTTMIFKMISREMLSIQQAAELDGPPAPKYRQLFVTQSRILAGRVQDYFGKMIMSQSAGQKTSQEIERLAMRNMRAPDEDDILDIDEDEEDGRSDLPKTFSALEDHHFPLFLTVSQLCKLLESDCDLSFKRRPRTKEHRRAEQQSWSVDIIDEMVLSDDDVVAEGDGIANRLASSDRFAERASIIPFETFFYMYWPHFPQPLTKGLDPALVWNEFMGVIKGSEESLDTEDGSNFLDKATYLNLSHRRQSTFANQRERIYAIFESYLKLKRKRGDYDAADRTHAILKALNGRIPGGRKIDFLYVDETQDNLIVDARLLRQLCGNPHGMFWAGDTAQTISMGSSFRFNDLKSFLHRLEERSCGLRPPIHPTSFQLDVNYRSHAGIVNCAHSVVELITIFWPDSLDTLARERGVVDGPRPVFFCGWNFEGSRYEQFLFHESGNIELGAQQCILVRDEKAREDLRREIGEVGLIMTLYESKGLEFNDVLLFNFFADSTATLAEWRVLLNMVDESTLGNVRVPLFDEIRHASICSELKSLYVGITRARCHVWILDIPKGGEARGEPMRMFWESKNLVQMCRPGDPVPELAVRSTQEQWAQQGRALFQTKHFQSAIFCFERAGLLLEKLVSHAHLLRITARQIPPLPKQRASKEAAYLRAAEAFVVCAGLPSNHSVAARLRYLSLGARCFDAAGAHASAAQAYLEAENFTEAARQFKMARLFDEAADVVLLHRKKVDPDVAEQYISIAKLHLHREHEIKKAARLFDSIDEQLEYLQEYEFDVARIMILLDLERWSDAAEIHYAEGRLLDAITLWIRAGDPESRQRARTGLLDSLWITLPLGKEPDEKQHSKLLELLRTLSGEPVDHDEYAMFLAILAKDYTQLLRLAREFNNGSRKNPIASLLCFDHALKKPPQMRNDDGKSVARYLEDYDSYAQQMQKVIADSLKADGDQWGQVAKLLGFTETNDGTTAAGLSHVLPTSILYEPLKKDISSQSINHSIPVASSHLSTVIRVVLGQRLRDRLLDEHDVCVYSRSFRPCLNFAVTGDCGRVGCHQEHLPRKSLTVEAFNLRTRLHMQQILIVHNMDPGYGDRKLQRIWQERLYETLFPIFYAFGHISVLSKPQHMSLSPDAAPSSRVWLSSIPEHQRASRVLSDWLRDRFYSLRPFRDDREDKFMTDAVQTAMLSFAIDRHNAVHYLFRANCIVMHRHPRLTRKEGYVMHDLLAFLEGSSKSSIASGVLFIKHVLNEQIPIDANTLLNVLEAVIGRTIIASCHSSHQITLPRTWIVNLLSSWDERSRIPITDALIIQYLFGPLTNLLESIWMNKDIDHMMYHGRSLSTVHMARTVMVFRICKSLALLGYNIRNSQLRDNIVKTLASLSRTSRNFPHLINPFVRADRWEEIARAVRSSTESPLDELILLGEAKKLPNIYTPSLGVRLCRFDCMSEVLPALEYVTASNFNPEAKPFVPGVLAQQPPPPPDAEPIEDDSTADESFNAQAGDIEVIAPNDLSVERTKEEITAAEVIQNWYRRRMVIKSREISEITRSRHRFIATSRVEVQKLQVLPTYRRIFLGPLPHVLTALQGCRQALRDRKQALKKVLSSKESLDYDKVLNLLTKCNNLWQTQMRISKNLELPSNFHHEGAVDELRKHVKEVDNLVKEVDDLVKEVDDLVKGTLTVTSSMQDFLWDMEIGYKGIVRVFCPRPTPKAMQRPSLNTEDIGG